MKEIKEYDLEKMKEVDLEKIDKDELVDINDVKIDINQTKEEKIKSFINQIKNPYCYKCGKVTIKISFSDNSKSLEDLMSDYISSL